MNIKRNRALDAMFKRYAVVVRKTTTTIIHALYGTEHVLTPMEFAVYEAAIKAIHCGYLAAGETGFEAWHERIAQIGGFALPTEAEEGIEAAKKYAGDYHSCCRLLSDRYMELFD
jgi:hypothetical protein